MKKEDLKFWVILVFLGAIITGFGLLNHYFFRTYAFDYAAYNFAWFDYAHLKISPSPIYWVDNMSFLQDHFSITLMILAPLYWILAPIFGTYSLLIIQGGFITAGGWAVYKIIQLKTKKNNYAILALLLYFATYGRFASIITDCNLEIILSSVVPLFWYFFEKKKYVISTLIFFFLILGRENFPIWFIFIGIFFLLEYWSDKKRRNILSFYMIASLVFFIVMFKVIIPALQNPDRPYSLFNYTVLGTDPTDAIVYLITHPLKSFILLFVNHSGDVAYDYVKAEFYIVYLLSGAFLLFFKPKYLLLFIPIIAQKMYNDAPVRWSIETYYSIEIVTLLPVAVFLTLDEIKFIKKEKIKIYVGYFVLLLAFLVTIHKLDFANRRLKWYGPAKNVFYKKPMYKPPYNSRQFHKELTIIPDTAKVSASTNIAPHLAFRKFIYYFPRVDDAQYIAVFESEKNYAFSEQNYSEKINNYVFSANWNEIISDYPLLIMKKEADTNKITRIICDFSSLTSDSLKFYDNQKKYTFSNANLLSNNTSFDDDSLSVKLDNNNEFALTIHLDNVKIGTNIRVTVWQKGADAVLVASAENTDVFYISSSKVVDQKNDWKKIQLDVIVKSELPDKILKIYVWKNADNQQDTYVDDFELMYL